jgi:hypothetical protein
MTTRCPNCNSDNIFGTQGCLYCGNCAYQWLPEPERQPVHEFIFIEVVSERMDKPLIAVVTSLLFVVVMLFLAIHVEAQVDNVGCPVFDNLIEDITDQYMDPDTGIYAQWYSGDPDLMAIAEARQSYYLWGGAGLGYFSDGTHWYFPVTTEYRVEDGTTDWFNVMVWVGSIFDVGDDGALHNPCGVYIIDRFSRDDYEPYLLE